jgi:hypothetical protein
MDILQAMDPEKEAFMALLALPQLRIFEAKSENPVFENQWLVSLKIPVSGNLRQSLPPFMLLARTTRSLVCIAAP